jgi:predicted TIM-barrel fold metal-dependent hydrolase
MKIIDAHTHVFAQYADLAVQVMDRCGIECCVTLEWTSESSQALQQHLQTFGAYPGRFIVFGTVDWRERNEPGFGERAARRLEADVAAGVRGLKIYKALGLEYRRPNGELWRVNAPELEPIWNTAGTLGIPILIHTADPLAFWEPVNERNFWNGVLYGEYAWWSYYRQGLPSPEELLGERNEVIAGHPHTTFICPHVGSKSDCLDAAADDLDVFPNLYYDLSARIPILGCSPRRAAHSREFMIAYQDRLLLGTDAIYDHTNVPTGMQAQCLYQPGEIALAGADARARYVETTAAFVLAHLDFLLTARVQDNPPFKRRRGGYAIHGLHLPPEVGEKICYGNARRLLI